MSKSAILDFPAPLRTGLAHENRELRQTVTCLRAELAQAREATSGAVAGGIAHDLNNVLAPMLMSIALLDEHLMDADSRRLLRVLQESAQRGASMVRQILTLARGVEHPLVSAEPRRLFEDLRRVLAETLPRSIELVIEVASDATPMNADPNELHQVLVNLCLNARDAMPAGGCLTLRAEAATVDEAFAATTPGAKPGRYVAMSVADTGFGMPDAVRARIFGPFLAAKQEAQGSGLGLSTAHTIVRAHGGFMLMNSAAGRGTTIRVFVPAMGGEGDETTAEETNAVARGNNELILIVDDESSVRALTSRLLSTYGYRVITAGNGAEAVAEFARNLGHVDAVLTDIMMPVMDGAHTMRALRTIDPDVKVIATTGHDGGAGMREATHGAAAVIPKPFHVDTLLRVIRQVLDA